MPRQVGARKWLKSQRRGRLGGEPSGRKLAAPGTLYYHRTGAPAPSSKLISPRSFHHVSAMTTRMLKHWTLAVSALLLSLSSCKKPTSGATTSAAASAAAPPPVTSIAPQVPTEPSAPASASAAAAAPAAPAPAAAATAKPHVHMSAYHAIERCCSSLSAKAHKPGPGKHKYEAAAAVCAGIAQRIKTGKANLAAARPVIRAQLHGVAIPSGC